VIVVAEGRRWRVPTEIVHAPSLAPPEEALPPNEALALAELEWTLSSPHTLEAIAEHLGVSRRTVARAEASALAKLKVLLGESEKEDFSEGLREPLLLSQKRIDRETGHEYGLPWTGMTPRRRTDE